MPETQLPPLPNISTIRERLPRIFPEGTPKRTRITSEMAVITIFVMFYTGALESRNHWIKPAHVYYMTLSQLEKTDNESRLYWANKQKWEKYEKTQDAYLSHSREDIRDETILYGLVPLGAVIINPLVPTTENKPRYALSDNFSLLFSEHLTENEINEKILAWQEQNLSREARTAIELMNLRGEGDIFIEYPDLTVHRFPPGESSIITKAVIEQFSKKFLHHPEIVRVSTSKKQLITENVEMLRRIGLDFSSLPNKKILPDIVLFDQFRKNSLQDTLLVFVEVVAEVVVAHRHVKAVWSELFID